MFCIESRATRRYSVFPSATRTLEFLIPQNLWGFVPLRAGILTAFLIRCYREKLNLSTPSHSCTCEVNHYDPIYPLCWTWLHRYTCAQGTFSTPFPLEGKDTGNTLLSWFLITPWRFESYPKLQKAPSSFSAWSVVAQSSFFAFLFHRNIPPMFCLSHI